MNKNMLQLYWVIKMQNENKLKEIISKFAIDGELLRIDTNNSGNINKTFITTFKMKDGTEKKYLIQKINTSVFTEPYKLMKNIEGVTNYLTKALARAKDPSHKTLEVIKTKEGGPLCIIEESNGTREYYRAYNYIDNAISYDSSINPQIVYSTGAAFGNFQRLLRNYPMSRLEETIKDFHNTPKRYQRLLEDIKIDSQNRALEVAKEIVYILQREDLTSLIIDKLGSSEVPFRVTHNDTKVNNVMMDRDTGSAIAVIDLDTVMPGSLLFDYGDGVRSTASSASEDETDLSKVYLDMKLFEAYTDGYLSEMAPFMTDTEISLMAPSIEVITLELAIRFLNDYINGDTYFKINYPQHNLDRARNQLQLVTDIESKIDEMNDYIMQKTRVLRRK